MKSPTYSIQMHHGLVLDLPPEQTAPDAWTGAENVYFFEQATKRVGGLQNFAAPLEGTTGPIHAANLVLPEYSYWVYCTRTKVYVTDGADHFDITPVGLLPSEPGQWTSTILNDVLVMNNQLNVPYYWDGQPSNVMLPLPGWPEDARCKSMRAYKYHLFAMHITENSVVYPDLLWWSAGAEPGAVPQEWLPTPSNDAGDVLLSDTPGGIVDGLPLRDAFIVYKDFASHIIQYTAGQLVFSARKLAYSSGIQSINAVTEIDGLHWVFTGTDVVTHDGQSTKSRVDNKCRRAIVDSVDPAYRQLCQVVARHADNQVWICIAEQGAGHLSKAYLINNLTGDIGTRTLPLVEYVARGVVTTIADSLSWDVDNGAWDEDNSIWKQATYSATDDSMLLCDETGNRLLDVDRTDQDITGTVSAYVERTGMNLGDPIAFKYVNRLVPRIEGANGTVINIRVGAQNYFNVPITWSDAQPFVIGEDVAINVEANGRLIGVRFSAETNTAWTLHGYTMAYTTQGIY